MIVNEDSVSFLGRFARELVAAEPLGRDVPTRSTGTRKCIDLLYLDSYDVDWNDPHPSALHHLMELCAAMPGLQSGSLVVVDDHLDFDNRPGKSKYIVPFMAAIGARKLFEAYQVGWVMP
jgi:hypothetical protein